MVSFDLKKKLFMEESCVSTMATFGNVLAMTVYLIILAMAMGSCLKAMAVYV